ncbi:MAG: hypothetical protein WC782_16600 [Methylococcaceae bacterium]|jgi:hypothetical protein
MAAIDVKKLASRIAEDSVGATIGAATGVGVAALVGIIAMPAITAIVPWGLVIGTVSGIMFKEIKQYQRPQEKDSNGNTP